MKSINNKVLVVELYMPASVGGLSVGKQLLSQGKAERTRMKKQKLDTDIHVGKLSVCCFEGLTLFLCLPLPISCFTSCIKTSSWYIIEC